MSATCTMGPSCEAAVHAWGFTAAARSTATGRRTGTVESLWAFLTQRPRGQRRWRSFIFLLGRGEGQALAVGKITD
jgi:hypothetical protein